MATSDMYKNSYTGKDNYIYLNDTQSPSKFPGAEIYADGEVYTSDGIKWSSTTPTITPFPRNRKGIVSAINALKNSGKKGVILFEDAVYDISLDSSSDPIIPYSGISFIGVRPTYAFTGHVPDSTFTLTSGTIFDGKNALGVVDGTGFELNNTDQASSTTAIVGSGATLSREAGKFATNSQSGITVDGIGFRNVIRAFDTGAAQNIGLTYSTIKWCVCENATADWAFKFHNFQHCDFQYLVAKTNLATGSGVDFAANVDLTTLIPGNSTIKEVYSYGIDQRTRGIRFAALNAGTGSQFNEVVAQRIQSNRYGVSTAKTISVTTTAGSSAVSVSAADAAWLKPEMSVVFQTTVPQWGNLNQTYFVTSVNTVANTITLADIPLAESLVITWNQSGTYNMSTGGFPSLSIIGGKNSLVTACNFNGVDVECTGSTSPIVTRRVRSSLLQILESFPGLVRSIVRRDSSFALTHNSLNGITIDDDSNVSCSLTGTGPLVQMITGNVTTTGAYHQRNLVNNTATPVNVTIAKDMPRGFALTVTQGSTGQVTFVAASGVTITNAIGLKTSGAQAVVHLVEVGINSYILTGSTAA